MPPKKAKWSAERRDVVTSSPADGSFHAVLPLRDGGKLLLTITVDVSPEREVRVLVNGEPGATLEGFTAWSDI